jgi:hypothetical protein
MKITPESIAHPRPVGIESGFTIVAVVGILLVLGLLGSIVYRSVNTDITHSGRDVGRVRAEFAAESAVQWALTEVGRKRPGKQPFTLATHDPDGKTAIPTGDEDEDGAPKQLTPGDVEMLEGAHGGTDKQGWIYQTTTKRELSVSNAEKEILSFKVWYPDDSTLRIQGRGEVDGSTSDVDLMSRLRDIAVPM